MKKLLLLSLLSGTVFVPNVVPAHDSMNKRQSCAQKDENCLSLRHDLEKGLDTEARDETGKTVLHKAIDEAIYFLPDNSLEKLQLVELLLKSGADTEARNESGDTPLLMVASAQILDNVESVFRPKNPDVQYELAKLLLHYGADPNGAGKDKEVAQFLLGVILYNSSWIIELIQISPTSGDARHSFWPPKKVTVVILQDSF